MPSQDRDGAGPDEERLGQPAGSTKCRFTVADALTTRTTASRVSGRMLDALKPMCTPPWPA